MKTKWSLAVSNMKFDFSRAVMGKKIDIISSLLSEQGVFEIQNKDFSIQEAGKVVFIQWLSSCLDTCDVYTTCHDKCAHCIIGNPVVLFNDGTFPRQVKNLSEKSKTGLMLEIQDGLITHIKFCSSFRKTENKFMFECFTDEIRKLMNSGLSFKDAYDIAFVADKE